MKANVGNADRILRILAGIAILAVALFVEGPARWAGLVGFVPLLTGIFGYCPLYAAFGFDTCPLAKKPS
jgi:hypothetical protein